MSTKKKSSPAKRSYRRRRAQVSGYGAYKEGNAKRYYRRYKKLKKESENQSLGSKVGAFLGHGAQQLLKAITGFGDYNVEANSIMQGGISPPDIVNTVQKNGFIVRHREYIADVLASTSFSVSTYDINPGLNGSFPYLSQIAKAFELYRLRGLVYEFKSMSSDAVLSASASSALGTVAMATQYNSLNPAFTSLIQLENHEFANASKPSCDFYHPVECKRSEIPNTELYIRTGAVPDGGDIRWFDLGQFNIATSGMQNATGVIGQLWCTYEVEFYQARYDAPTGILTDHVQNSSCTNTAWIGASHVFVPGCSLGLSVDSNNIYFPSGIRDGTFLIYMKYVPTGGAAATATPTIAVTNCSYLQLFCDASGFDKTLQGGNATGLTTSVLALCYVIKVTAANASLAFSGGTMPSANMDLIITQFDADITT